MVDIVKKTIGRMSFRRQIAITFTAGLFLLSIITSFVVSTLSSQVVEERLISEGLKTTETFATQSTLALLFGSPDNIKDYASAVSTYPDVIGLAVYDIKHNKLLGMGVEEHNQRDISLEIKKPQLLEESPEAWTFVAPVRANSSTEENESPFKDFSVEPELLGVVHVIISKASLDRIANKIIQVTFLVSLSLAALILLIVLQVSKHLTNPIKDLASVMNQAEDGKKNVRANAHGPAEIVDMGVAFNKMMNVLEARTEELEYAKQWLEERVQERTAELAKSNINLTAAKEAAESANKAKSQFLANMSHEIRTPLNGVIGLSELLSDTNLNEQQSHFASVIHESAQSLLLMLNDVLDISKFDAGKLTLESIPFDLYETLFSIFDMLSTQASQKGLDLRVNFSPDTPFMLDGDPVRLRQILTNLVGNALKFTEKGQVDIRVNQVSSDEHSSLIRFEIIDTGIGIAPEAQSKIFNSFTQADDSMTRRYGGTGLGTTITKDLVELMGGCIGLHSELHKGSCFWFEVTFAKVEMSQNMLRQSTKNLRALVALQSPEQGNQLLSTLDAILPALEIVPMNELSKRGGTDNNAQEKPFNLIILINDNDLQTCMQMAEMLEDGRVHVIICDDNMARESTGFELKKDVLYVDIVSSENIINTLHAHSVLLRFQQKDLNISLPRSAKEKSGRHILVAEDNLTNQLVIKEILERAGYTVTLVDNGADAFNSLLEGNFEAAVFDLQMPKMTGLEAAVRYRDTLNGKGIPIIILSANTAEEALEKEEIPGIDAYLTKPVNARHLLDSINEFIARSTTMASALSANTPKKNPPPALINRKTIEQFIDMSHSAGFRDALLNAYENDSHALIVKIADAIKQNNKDLFLSTLHALKGCSVNVGAERMAYLCQQAETWDAEQFAEKGAALLKQIQALHQETLDALKMHLG